MTETYKELVRMFLLHKDLYKIFFDEKYNTDDDLTPLD